MNTVEDAIKAICGPIEGDRLCIEVRRSNLLKDALKELRKRKFIPTKPLMVRELINIILLCGTLTDKKTFFERLPL